MSRNRKMMAYIPDDTDVDLDSAVAVAEPDEDTIETLEEVSYICTDCHTLLSASELNKKNPDVCPECREETIMEAK